MLAHRPVDRDVRLNPARLQALDEGLGVIALVGAEGRPLGQALAESRRRLALGRSGRQRRFGRRHKPVAVLHQGMAEIAKTALLACAFTVKARILVGRRGVRRVRALGLAEVGLAVAPGRRRLARAVPRAFARGALGTEALHRRPGLEQSPVNRKMFAAQKPLHLRAGRERGQKPCAITMRDQADAVPREGRGGENVS